MYLDITGLSGVFVSQTAATGQAAWLAAQNNAINISGNLTQTGIAIESQINSLSGYITGFNGGSISYLTGLLPTGLDTYQIWHTVVFSTIPRVAVTLELSGSANGTYGFSISGRTVSGFWLNLTDTVDQSGVYADVIARV